MSSSPDPVQKRKAFEMSTQQRRSMCVVPGREGKFVGKGSHSGKAIAVFTSGGDAQGMTECAE